MNIYVGNLAFSTTDHDLRQLFEPYGVVDKINVITDRDTGRSKGFGFVEMPDSTAAKAAIQGSTARSSRAVPSRSMKPSRVNRVGSPAAPAGKPLGCKACIAVCKRRLPRRVAVAVCTSLPYHFLSGMRVIMILLFLPAQWRLACLHLPAASPLHYRRMPRLPCHAESLGAHPGRPLASASGIVDVREWGGATALRLSVASVVVFVQRASKGVPFRS